MMYVWCLILVQQFKPRAKQRVLSCFWFLPDRRSDKFSGCLASLQSSCHSQLNLRSNMTTEKVRGQRSLWIASGHGRWLMSHGLLKCQLDSWGVIIRNLSKLLEKCVDTVAFVLIIYLCCVSPCVCAAWGRQACQQSTAASQHWVKTHPVVPNNTWFTAAFSCVVVQQRHLAINICN